MMRFWLSILLFLSLLHANDEARLLFYGNCTACHMEVGKKAAPHFSEIKGYYKLAYPSKEAFVSHMTHWVSSPDRNSSKLPDAIKAFQLMPNISVDKMVLEEITAYLFDCDEF